MSYQLKSVIFVESLNDIHKPANAFLNIVIYLEGQNMMTLGEAYVEFANKLQFPDYFGRNMNALYDMLCDLSWLRFSEVTLVINEAFKFLVNGSQDDKNALLNLLEEVSKFWATPINLGEVWDREGISFKTVLVEK